MSKKLNEQETKFLERYLITGKPYDSAIYAGYAETTAKTKAFTWVSDGKCPSHKRHLLDAIHDAKKARARETKIDAEYVLRRLFDDIEADISELYDEDGKLKSVHDWPEVWRKGLVEGIETDADGKVTKVKVASRTKLKQMLGDHTDVQAFIKNMNLTMDDSLADRIEKARKRAHEAGN